MRFLKSALMSAVPAACLLFGPSAAHAQGAGSANERCGQLRAIDGGDVVIDSVAPVSSGAGLDGTKNFGQLPKFCRLRATIRPSAASNIKVEIWLPENWNGRFLGTGNGGLGGVIDYDALADGVRRGFAVANTDLGTSQGIEAMIGKMDMVIDFGHRATHRMTLLAKTAVERYYGRKPAFSYFRGCSTGGGQGLHEVQRYPDDYDGVLAGAPGASRVPAHLAFQWAFVVTHKDAQSALTPQLRSLWAARVMAACDGIDGLRDGLISAPQKCTIDPAVMECGPSVSGDCLTAAQVATLRAIYAGPRHSVTGAQLFPGYYRGTELSFSAEQPSADQPNAAASKPPFPFPFFWVWGMNWDWRNFNFGSDVDAMFNTLNFAVDATNPDIRRFAGHSGRLIIYQGLADPIQVPQAAIDYTESVERTMPDEAKNTLALFLAPGMSHCGGGYGPNSFGNDWRSGPSASADDSQRDLLAALQKWVEQDRAPDQVIAVKFAGNVPGGDVEMSRPLCRWPKEAVLKLGGDPRRAEGFDCK